MIQENCFAFRVNSRGIKECTALEELYCSKEKCNFYKKDNVAILIPTEIFVKQGKSYIRRRG